mmetsp:Transcript_2133/g.4904  ORF Transcript_2133/g.4904 Transcript_2133/m.4904 type:complete len:346 (-) Transcript_2133:38-1075(-)
MLLRLDVVDVPVVSEAIYVEVIAARQHLVVVVVLGVHIIVLQPVVPVLVHALVPVVVMHHVVVELGGVHHVRLEELLEVHDRVVVLVHLVEDLLRHLRQLVLVDVVLLVLLDVAQHQLHDLFEGELAVLVLVGALELLLRLLPDLRELLLSHLLEVPPALPVLVGSLLWVVMESNCNPLFQRNLAVIVLVLLREVFLHSVQLLVVPSGRDRRLISVGVCRVPFVLKQLCVLLQVQVSVPVRVVFLEKLLLFFPPVLVCVCIRFIFVTIKVSIEVTLFVLSVKIVGKILPHNPLHEVCSVIHITPPCFHLRDGVARGERGEAQNKQQKHRHHRRLPPAARHSTKPQ